MDINILVVKVRRKGRSGQGSGGLEVFGILPPSCRLSPLWALYGSEPGGAVSISPLLVIWNTSLTYSPLAHFYSLKRAWMHARTQ